MLRRFFSRSESASLAERIYGSLAAQARDERFFTDFAFPDTVIGRLEVLCLHMMVVTHFLAMLEEERARELNQQIFDVFTAELDRALRQIGIGDTAVPKRKKRMAKVLFAQIEQLAGPLEAGDAVALGEAVGRRFHDSQDKGRAGTLALYLLDSLRALRAGSGDFLERGQFAWPAVASPRDGSPC